MNQLLRLTITHVTYVCICLIVTQIGTAYATNSSLCSSAASISASSEYNDNNVADSACDGDSAIYGWGSVNDGINDTLQFNFDSGAVRIDEYQIHNSCNQSGGWCNETYSPKTWKFEGWSGSAWVVLDTQTDGMLMMDSVSIYRFTNNTSYTAYRFYITLNEANTNGYARFTEVWLYGDTPVVDTTVATLTANVQHHIASTGSTSSNLEVTAKNISSSAVSEKDVAFSITHYPTGSGGHSLDTNIVTTSSSGTAAAKLTIGDKNGIYIVHASVDSGSETFVIYTDKVDIAGSAWELRGFSGMDTSGTTSTSSELNDDLGTQNTSGRGALVSGEYRFYTWDPDSSSDPDFSNYQVNQTSINVGRGYWIKSFSAATVDVSGTETSGTYPVSLQSGWNLVSNPFWHYIDYDSDVKFETYPANPVSPDSATASILSENALFWYDNSAGSYKWGPNSTTAGSNAVNRLEIKPWLGYWVKVTTSCTMWFYPNPRVPTVSTNITTNQSPLYRSGVLTGGRGAWALQIIAHSGTRIDDLNYIGVQTNTSSVGAPPKQFGGISVIVRPYGINGDYVQSILASGNIDNKTASTNVNWNREAVWEVEVTGPDQAGEVSLSVSDVVSLPQGVPLRLRDMAAGIEQDLKSSSSYTYTAYKNELRRFQISASPALFPSEQSVTYPTACFITAVFPEYAMPVRKFREYVMEFSGGRKIVAAYYWISSRFPCGICGNVY